MKVRSRCSVAVRRLWFLLIVVMPGCTGRVRPAGRPDCELEAGVGDGGGPGVFDGGLRGGEGDQPGTRGVAEDPFDGVFGVGDRAWFEPQIRHVSGVAGSPPSSSAILWSSSPVVPAEMP